MKKLLVLPALMAMAALSCSTKDEPGGQDLPTSPSSSSYESSSSVAASSSSLSSSSSDAASSFSSSSTEPGSSFSVSSSSSSVVLSSSGKSSSSVQSSSSAPSSSSSSAGNSSGSNADGIRPANPEPVTAKTAIQYFADEGIKAGWNLGNSLDAVKAPVKADTKAEETAIGNPKVTQTLIDGVKQAGFDIVRICVTWIGHIGPAPAYTIDEARLRRVAEVVNMVHKAGMKAIINIHHDGNYTSPPNTWGFLKFAEATKGQANNEEIKEQLGKVWTQIAEYFKNYGDYLIFETFNEVHSGNWGSNAPASEQDLHFEWKQTALNAIRATGGNNATRFVAVPGLGSTEPSTVISAHNRGKFLPSDGSNGTNKLIVAVHFYSPWRYTVAGVSASQGENLIHELTTAEFNNIAIEAGNIKTNFINNGIAVYYGEWGAPTDVRSTMSETIKNTHIGYIKEVARAAHANGIVPIVWDDGGNFKILERSNGKPKTGFWTDVLNALMDGI